MKIKRLGKCGLWFAVAALSCVLIIEFMPELFALSWHVRHGRTAQLERYDGKKYGVTVPTFWWAEVDDSRWRLSLIKKPGNIRGFFRKPEWAIMSFSLEPASSTAREIQEVAPVL